MSKLTELAVQRAAKEERLHRIGKRIRDLALEIVIAVAFVCAVITCAVMRPNDNIAETHTHFHEFALVVNTLLVFGILIKWFRDAWRRRVFWVALAAMMLLHVVACLLMLDRLAELPFIYYALIDVGEWGVLDQVLRRILSGNVRLA